jgi:hypothetical protein
VDLGGHGVDPLADAPTVCVSSLFCLSRVSTRSVNVAFLLHHFDQHPDRLAHLRLTRFADLMQFIAMLGRQCCWLCRGRPGGSGRVESAARHRRPEKAKLSRMNG